jgi:hypothetical protein
MSPLDLERLATRIEVLQRTSTHGWMPGDGMEFTKQLPTARTDPRYKLPDPKDLREASKALQRKETIEFTIRDYQTANQRIMRMEGIIRQNKPTSTRRMIYDRTHGRFGR